jgi:hypothetical protein
MTYKEIKESLEDGKQFKIDDIFGGWSTVNRIKIDGALQIMYFDKSGKAELRSYKTIDSYAKRIKELLNTGYDETL